MVYLDATPTQKETRNSLFTSFQGRIFEREMGQFYQEKGFLFLVSSTMCAYSIFMVSKKQGRSDVPIIFPLLPQSKQRRAPKIPLPLEPPAKREEYWNW